MVQAVIVAAGHGSRLYPVTDVIPKSLLPIGEQQRPMLEMAVRHCVKHGITDFVFCLNSETGKQIRNYFDDGKRLGINITYSYSDEPQGTSGEIKLAFDKGLITYPTLIYYGDTLCKTNLTEMMSNKLADVSVVVNDLVTIPYGFVEDYGGVATRILEKPTIKEMIPYASGSAVGAIMSIYYVDNPIFFHKYCGKGIDVSKDILPTMMRDGFRVVAYHDKEPFIDVGNWKNYGDAQKWKE